MQRLIPIVLTYFLLTQCGNVYAQQTQLSWTHVLKENGQELIITDFFAKKDSVLLRYECEPSGDDNYLELRSRKLFNNAVKDTTYIRCEHSVKITAQTRDSTYTELVPQKMLRRLAKEDKPDWIK